MRGSACPSLSRQPPYPCCPSGSPCPSDHTATQAFMAQVAASQQVPTLQHEARLCTQCAMSGMAISQKQPHGRHHSHAAHQRAHHKQAGYLGRPGLAFPASLVRTFCGTTRVCHLPPYQPGRRSKAAPAAGCVGATRVCPRPPASASCRRQAATAVGSDSRVLRVFLRAAACRPAEPSALRRPGSCWRA